MRILARAALTAILGAGLMACAVGGAGRNRGDWPEPRQNGHLTGCQPLPGKIKGEPKELATLDLGRQAAPFKAVQKPDGAYVGLSLVGGALQCRGAQGNLLWKSHPAGLNFTDIVAAEDLDGDGHCEIVLRAGRACQPFGAAVMLSLDDGRLLWRYDVEPVSYDWSLLTGQFLPGTKAKQIIVIMMGYPPDAGFGFTAMFEFAKPGAAPAQKWRFDFDKYTCFPGLFQVDLDGDGIEELALECHSHMWFLDAATGKPKHYVEWEVPPANHRSYGLNRFIDVNGDGRKDFVVIAPLAEHHEVLLNKNGKMELAWFHGWGESVTTGKVETTWPEPPIVDVDGDGKLEMVLSMFNSEDKQEWLLRIYDAATGQLKYRMPGVTATSTADLDGDGRWEILANATSDPAQAKLDGARILKVVGGKLVSIWADPASTAVKPILTGLITPNLFDNQPFLDMPGEPLPLIRRQDPATTATQFIHYSVALRDEKAAPEPGRIVMGQAEGRTLVGIPWVSPPPYPAGAFNLELQPKVMNSEFQEMLAADLDGDGINELVTCYVYLKDVKVYKLRGGRFETTGAYQSDGVPVIADFNGDGKLDIALVHIDSNKPPVVEVITPSLQNKVLWRNELPKAEHITLASKMPPYLRAGRFTGAKTPDLYLFAGSPVVRSMVLEGKTGRKVWEKSEMKEIDHYYGPTKNLASVDDVNGDGKEDLVFTNPDFYNVADGATGNLLLGPLFPPKIFHQASQGLYTMPVILDRDSTKPMVCLCAGHYFLGAMTIEARPFWYALPVTGQARCAREGFMRLKDGSWVMGFGRQNGSFACVEMATGALRWELPVEASCTDVAACDIDGDGQSEFIFGTSHGEVVAVQDAGSKPRVIWRKELGAPARFLQDANSDYGGAIGGRPIVADLNGDGASEVVIQTMDGRIHALGAQ